MVQPTLFFEVHGRRATPQKSSRSKKKAEEQPLELLATMERTSSHVLARVPHKRISLSCPLDNISVMEKLLGAVNVLSYDINDLALTCTTTGDVWEIPNYSGADIAVIVLCADATRSHTESSSPTPHHSEIRSHSLTPEGGCAI
jgi:hypothetical protein